MLGRAILEKVGGRGSVPQPLPSPHGPLSSWLPFPEHVLGRPFSCGLRRTLQGGRRHPCDRALFFLITFVTSNTLVTPLICLLCHQALQPWNANPVSAGPFVCFGPCSLPGADEGAWNPEGVCPVPGGGTGLSAGQMGALAVTYMTVGHIGKDPEVKFKPVGIHIP